jgi:hypothetical protein
MTTPLYHHYYNTMNGPPFYYYDSISSLHLIKETLTKRKENARIAGWTQLPAQWMQLVRRHVLATLLRSKSTRPTRQKTKTAEEARIAGWTQLPAQWMQLVRRHVLATPLLNYMLKL